MGSWKSAWSHRHWWRASLLLAIVWSLAAGYSIFGVSKWAAPQVSAAQATASSGMARLSGSVDSSKPFKAAQVFIRNVDKRIMYMVYTNAGQFKAVSLFPGNYEVVVRTKGLESDVQKLAVKAGDSPTLKITLRDAKAAESGAGALDNYEAGTVNNAGTALTFQSYDEIYPPGPGKQVAEQVCMVCHGENFFPTTPASEAVWNARIDHMQGRDLFDHDAATYAEGLLSYKATVFPFSRKDRADLVAYLVKNFGPAAKKRAVRTDKEMPLDEAKLSKAMFMEYYLPQDPPGQLGNAPEYQQARAAGGLGGHRTGQDIRFDQDGNVWESDRGIPRRLVKLDPRTGERKEWVTPHPKSDVHEVLVGRDGMIWMPEHAEGGVQSFLLGFNPKTEKWEQNIDLDPDNVVRERIKWMQSTAVDSKNNIYVGWINGGALSKYERATGKVSVFRVPTPHTIPYGIVADKNDNIWMAEWSGGKIAKFDTHNNAWTEFAAPTYPGQVRRPNVDYQNNIWWGIWSAGRRPGKLVKLDQTTGRMTEYTIPQWNSMPYDVAPDLEGNIWFADSPTPDRSAAIAKFNTKDQTFTFYPKPQFSADTPKIQMTRDGAIWFAPRGSQRAAAISVLYPDMDKITTLGAFYVNGPPGYPFKVAPSTTTRVDKPTARAGGQ
jgi:streptogramin lyase/mono/diheme cytochrome c family protein